MHAPSSANKCANEVNFCNCENECVECYDANSIEKYVIQIDLEAKIVSGSACKNMPFSVIDFSDLKLITDLEAKNYNEYGKTILAWIFSKNK